VEQKKNNWVLNGGKGQKCFLHHQSHEGVYGAAAEKISATGGSTSRSLLLASVPLEMEGGEMVKLPNASDAAFGLKTERVGAGGHTGWGQNPADKTTFTGHRLGKIAT